MRPFTWGQDPGQPVDQLVEWCQTKATHVHLFQLTSGNVVVQTGGSVATVVGVRTYATEGGAHRSASINPRGADPVIGHVVGGWIAAAPSRVSSSTGPMPGWADPGTTGEFSGAFLHAWTAARRGPRTTKPRRSARIEQLL